MKFGLKESLIEEIASILGEDGKVKKAVIFGSRARGDFNPASDIDIAVYGMNILTSEELNSIRSKIDEIECIYKFDIVEVNRIDKRELVKNIENEGIPFFQID
jgi:uncharacterized protein